MQPGIPGQAGPSAQTLSRAQAREQVRERERLASEAEDRRIGAELAVDMNQVVLEKGLAQIGGGDAARQREKARSLIEGKIINVRNPGIFLDSFLESTNIKKKDGIYATSDSSKMKRIRLLAQELAVVAGQMDAARQGGALNESAVRNARKGLNAIRLVSDARQSLENLAGDGIKRESCRAWVAAGVIAKAAVRASGGTSQRLSADEEARRIRGARASMQGNIGSYIRGSASHSYVDARDISARISFESKDRSPGVETASLEAKRFLSQELRVASHPEYSGPQLEQFRAGQSAEGWQPEEMYDRRIQHYVDSIQPAPSYSGRDVLAAAALRTTNPAATSSAVAAPVPSAYVSVRPATRGPSR